MAISSNGVAGLRTGVCTSSTRPTAPYEGQMIYETDTDLTYVWGGSAWQQVSGGTAVGNSGLVYVTSSTVGAGVSSHAVNNCFSSTYDNYKVIYQGGVGSNPVSIAMTLGASATGYYLGMLYVVYATSATAVAVNNNAPSWGFVGEAMPNSCSLNVELGSPFLAKWTTISGSYAGSVSGSHAGYHGVATSYTGFTLSTAGNTMTGGTVTVYGYRK